MIIDVNKRQRIVGTSTCWQIEEKKVVKGMEVWTAKYYYNSLEVAAMELYHKNIRTIQESDVGRILAKMTDHMEEIKNALLPRTIREHKKQIEEAVK